MTTLAQATIAACHRAGVAEYCVCAGSRNSELVRVLVGAGVRVWHFFEERCAAFFALGRVRVLGRPVAIVTTSGTAAAELFPAMIEAHYQGLPLLAITADRPRRFRSSGAPQAIEQLRLFGDYPNLQADVAEPAEVVSCLNDWKWSGPAHLNVCFEDPQGEVATVALDSPASLPKMSGDVTPKHHLQADLVLLGDLFDHERAMAQRILQDWHGPVWAEAASGLCDWLGARLVHGGDSALRHLAVTKVLRLGGVPSCRFWRDLESRLDIEVTSASRSGHSGLARESQVVPMADIAPMQGKVPFVNLPVDDLVAEFPRSECGYMRRVSELIPAGSAQFLGNSLSIREWNLAANANRPWPHFHVMRGANGIDGNLSFFYGMGADAAESWAVVGDLTALYDLAAPWILGQLPPARRRIVIMNNGGGMIFRKLPSLKSATEAEREVIENPHALRFQHWAALWNMQYLKIETEADLDQPLPVGDVVIEILPDAGQSDQFWAALARREQEVYG